MFLLEVFFFGDIEDSVRVYVSIDAEHMFWEEQDSYYKSSFEEGLGGGTLVKSYG